MSTKTLKGATAWHDFHFANFTWTRIHFTHSNVFINVDDFQLLVGYHIIKTENGATRWRYLLKASKDFTSSTFL